MYRSDPFSCPDHLAGISETGFWSPLEKAAMMRSSVGIIGTSHPLSQPAYQQALANWRPTGASDSLAGARGTQPRPLAKVLESAADAPMGESTYFTVGAVLGWWKIRTSKTGQRATFTLEGSTSSIRCVMWSNALRRHGDDLPKDGDLVVAVGRIQTRSFTRTEVDEATGEEVTTTHYRHEAVVDRLSKVGDPIREQLNAAEHRFRSRTWWRALDVEDPSGQTKEAAIRRMVGFAPPQRTQPPAKASVLEPVDLGEVPGAVYATGASLALGILRHCKVAAWPDLVSAMNAVADGTATPDQQTCADRFDTLVLSDDDWSALAVTPLETLAFSPRYSLMVCSDCGFPIGSGAKGSPRKCTALPFCEGTLSKKIAPAKAEKLASDDPRLGEIVTAQPSDPAPVRHLRPVRDSEEGARPRTASASLPCDVLVLPHFGMRSIRPVLFRADGSMEGEVSRSSTKHLAHVTLPLKESDAPDTALVIADPDVYQAAQAALGQNSRLSLADFADLQAAVCSAHQVMFPRSYRSPLTVVSD